MTGLWPIFQGLAALQVLLLIAWHAGRVRYITTGP